MLILNSIIKEEIISFYEEYLITFFLKTIHFKKINFNKKYFVNKLKKKKIFYKKYFFSNFKKKIKFGYYINKENNLFISNNLISSKKIKFSKKIYLFEVLFKIVLFKNKYFTTRKLNFKKKTKKKKLRLNKIYLGIIKNIVSYGIFIDLGKIDGLLHISDIPKFKKIYKNLYIKKNIIVKVIKFDKNLKKISLNLKKTYNQFYYNFNNILFFKIKKIQKNFCLCFFNNKKIYIKKKNFFKKNDIIKLYLIKKKDNFIYISKYHKILKNENKYIKYNLKLKFNEFYLFSYKKKKFLSINNNKNTKINNNEYYKFYILNILNNEFYKIIFLNNKKYIRFEKNFLLINIDLDFLNIINFKFLNNTIYFFISKY